MTASEAQDTAALHLLAVDDHQAELILLEEVCADLPAQLTTFADSEAAWDWLQTRSAAPPHLILLGLSSRGQGGLAWLQRLRQEPRLAGTVVVIRSGRKDAGTVQAAYQAQANAFIPKVDSLLALETQMSGLITFWSGCLLTGQVE